MLSAVDKLLKISGKNPREGLDTGEAPRYSTGNVDKAESAYGSTRKKDFLFTSFLRAS
jgi:hypothetical protein